MLKTLAEKAFQIIGYDITKRTDRGPSSSQSVDLSVYGQIYAPDSLEARRFYNIGAGSFRHPAWTNIDHASEWCHYKENQCDIDWDILDMTRLPVDDGTAELAYSSHTIEHVTDEAALHLFREAYRILKPGGALRVTTPNIDLYYRAYRENDRLFFYWEDEPSYTSPELYKQLGMSAPLGSATIGQVFLYEFASSVSFLHVADIPKITDDELASLFGRLGYEEALDWCTSRCPLELQRTYPGNHINWWNERKARRLLSAAGFEDVYRSSFGQSYVPVLRETRFFDNTLAKLSLYMEARKIPSAGRT
ncbi:MAG: class I SAM-dependent methyltransferase [Phycisphaerae bacterium]|nr:class I SAM-dependent methyltransferase [Phycisphaerae bacterium]